MDPRPTAIVAGGNQVLSGCIRALIRHGIRIPDDISLITCDEVDLSELHEPPIASVARDTLLLGRTAAELLLERLGGARATDRAAARRPSCRARAAVRCPPAPDRTAGRTRLGRTRRAPPQGRSRGATVTFAEPLPACDSPRTAPGAQRPVRAPSVAEPRVPDVIHGTEHRPLVAGRTLFDYADEVSTAVPASCRRTGRCRECVVEVRQGGEGLSPRTEPEAYLKGQFRLACQAQIEDLTSDVEFAIIRRRMRILGPSDEPHVRLDPVVTADDLAVRYAGQPIDLRRAARPGSRDRHRHHDGRRPDHRPADRRTPWRAPRWRTRSASVAATS